MYFCFRASGFVAPCVPVMYFMVLAFSIPFSKLVSGEGVIMYHRSLLLIVFVVLFLCCCLRGRGPTHPRPWRPWSHFFLPVASRLLRHASKAYPYPRRLSSKASSAPTRTIFFLKLYYLYNMYNIYIYYLCICLFKSLYPILPIAILLPIKIKKSSETQRVISSLMVGF